MQNALRIAYQAFIGNPISTAPRLVVPEIAMANTLASSPGISAGRAATTGDAMISGKTGVDGSKGKSGRLPTLVAIAAASFIAVVGVVITIMMTSGAVQAPKSTPSTSVASEVRPEVSAPPSAQPQPTVVSIDYQPAASAKTSPPKPDAGTGKKFVAPPAATPIVTTTPPRPVEPDMDKRTR